MSGPNLSIETPQENQVYEITYDGHEIPQAPLTMSENLSKLASRINWSDELAQKSDIGVKSSAVDDESAADAANLTNGALAADTEHENNTSDTEQAPVWPWQEVRDKIRCAYTEVCVLSDVLTIARHKRYMVLDAVTQDPPEPRLLVQVVSKRKALLAAALILNTGAERMRENLADQKRSRSVGDFYTELLRMRQSWRLRKIGNSIIGDLSYKQVGSRFWLPGTFEVKKSDEDGAAEETADTGKLSSSTADGAASPSVSPLVVTVPNELRGVAYIYVVIKFNVADQQQTVSARSSLFESGAAPTAASQQLHWRVQLEAAQNVLFCRELIAQLAREAVQLQSGQWSHLVVGDTITSTILPNVQLVIGLMHNQPNSPHQQQQQSHDKNNSSFGAGETTATVSGDPAVGDNNYVLEHSLHQLLRELHHNNISRSYPHPAAAALGASKRRRLAGPSAMSRSQLLKLVDHETILERIVRQARHFVLRMRTAAVLDSCARNIRHPLIVNHWNSLNSPNQSCCKVNFVTHGYDSVHRTTFLINVLEDSLRCVCRDGRVLTIGSDASELYHAVMCQVSLHNIFAAQSLARIVGWSVRASSNWQPSDSEQPALCEDDDDADSSVRNCSTCVLISACGRRQVLIKCWPSIERSVQVFVVESTDDTASYSSDLLTDDKWRHLSAPAKEVRWQSMEGKNFLNKLELLLASLSKMTNNVL